MENKAGITFDEQTAKRIVDAVRTVEQMPIRQPVTRRRRHTAPIVTGRVVCAAIVTGKTGTDYDVDLYGNGLIKPSTDTATMQIVEIHINDIVPNGTKVIAYPANVNITSGWGPS